MLYTALDIMYTESLKSARHTETRKVTWGVAVGGEENSHIWETMNVSACEHHRTTKNCNCISDL